MYVRTIRAQALPGKLDEVDTTWREFWLSPKAQAVIGSHTAYWAVDRAANTTINISLWDTPPEDNPEYVALVQEFGPRMRGLTSGPPTIETYEVLEHM